jgi:FtsZ-interacting cell division protein YlmF
MKDKNNNHVIITAYGNSTLDLFDEMPGLFVLSEYNDQYQQNQKKKYKNKINKKRKKA